MATTNLTFHMRFDSISILRSNLGYEILGGNSESSVSLFFTHDRDEAILFLTAAATKLVGTDFPVKIALNVKGANEQ
jgi:hypothetical protein